MDKIIVLVTSGKGEFVDSCTVCLFDSRDQAERFIAESSTNGKYWRKCQIVNSGHEVNNLTPNL